MWSWKYKTFHSHSKPEPRSLRQLLDFHLHKHYNTEHPLKITMMAAMHSGMGDFIHLFDYYKFYINNYKALPIKFKCYADVNEHFEKIKKIYCDQLPKALYELDPSEFSKEKILQSDLVVCTEETARNYLNFSFEAPIAALENQDGIINISLPMLGRYIVYMQGIQPSHALIQSSCEYYDKGEPLYIGSTVIQPNFFYDEAFMGVGEKAKGIKIYNAIYQFSQMDEKEKAGLIDSLENKKLAEKLKSGSTEQDYLKTHSVSCGYMQTSKDTTKFILTTMAINKKDQIDIFINTDQIEIDDLKLKLKSFGVSSIEIINNSGEVINKVSLSDGETKDFKDTKTLRLIHFPGISEPDKDKWIGLSDCVAASGDSSLSELISSRKFPVFTHYKAGDMQKSFIAKLQKKEPLPKELITYLEMTLSRSKDAESNTIEYVQNHHTKILTQWQDFCDDVIKNKNVEAHQHQLIDNTIIASIFRKGDQIEIEQLLKFKPDWKTNDTNFIFLAILGQDAKTLERTLELMLKTNKELFEKLLSEEHPSLKKTPLQYVLMKRDSKFIDIIYKYFQKTPSFDQELEVEMKQTQQEISLIQAAKNDDVKKIKELLNLPEHKEPFKILNKGFLFIAIRIAMENNSIKVFNYLLSFVNLKTLDFLKELFSIEEQLKLPTAYIPLFWLKNFYHEHEEDLRAAEYFSEEAQKIIPQLFILKLFSMLAKNQSILTDSPQFKFLLADKDKYTKIIELLTKTEEPAKKIGKTYS